MFYAEFEHTAYSFSVREGREAPAIPVEMLTTVMWWIAEIGGAFFKQEQMRGKTRVERFTKMAD